MCEMCRRVLALVGFEEDRHASVDFGLEHAGGAKMAARVVMDVGHFMVG
jgi:hypothetical protein